MRFLKTLLYTATVLAAVFGATSLSAQDDEATYPKVNELSVVFDGFQAVSDQFVFSNIQLREGMNFSSALVDQSIRTLYGTGRFEFVEVSVDNAESGGVNVTFEVISKYVIDRVIYSGSDAFGDSRLASRAEFEAGGALDEYEVSVASDKLLAYYVKKGFKDAKVDYRIQRDANTGKATVTFDIDEGNKIKITNLTFEGNAAFKNAKLARVLETKKHSWISWLTGGGKFDEDKFKEDLELLRSFYRNHGFLDVVVDEDLVEITYSKDNKMQIKVVLSEGELYSVGKMTIEGATIFTTGELMSGVKIKTGQPFSPERVDKAAVAVNEYYTARGYLDSRSRAERVPDMDTRSIDLVFRVRESDKFYVESIKVEGNTITKTRVIIRELALRPGDVFDLTRMKTSERRLINTRFFGNVRLTPENTNVPGRRDLGVTVSEGRTGNLTFGAGIGSVEGMSIYFELTQGNFDITNWRSGFRGDGQKFRFRASLGASSNELIIAFEEPWLFEQHLAFGVELFRRESSYDSSEYDETRMGFELYLRRRLFELVEGRLAYRLEQVDISNVDRDNSLPEDPDGSTPGDGTSNTIQAAEGKDYVSKVSFTLLRDNRDSLLFTRKGNRTTLTAEYAGLGGDVNYYKFEARTAQYIPTFEPMEQTLSILGRIGTATPHGDSDDVPFYDRFYLGGPDSLRGFEHRDIGPRDSDDKDEPIGGDTYSMISLEYSFRVAEPFALVVFYDWGFVNADDYDLSLSNYADNWGVGARILVMGSPLKLDLGFPITTPDEVDDNGAQFNFSFGTRF